ncbi:MAG TPA: hypothetical protein VMT22_02580, partial [Terriglobales bacterium]|nr:hypothetical protein [Terriglobales bacterium]
MANDELCSLTLAGAAAALRKKEVSSLDLTEACLKRIEAIDGRLHSFITWTTALARKQALQADQE